MTKRYEQTVAVDDVRPGFVTGFLGPNSQANTVSLWVAFLLMAACGVAVLGIGAVVFIRRDA